jgi:tetratricopeptide (TPR) repeat protein/predicted Ser/Thr protein kinase
MRTDVPFEDESPSLAALAFVDERCVRLEAEWRAGRQPLLEDYLADVAGTVREELLPALLAVELGQRCRRGDVLVAEEYLRRFPEAATLLPRLIAEAVGNEMPFVQQTEPRRVRPAEEAPSTGSLALQTGKASEESACAEEPPVLGDYDILGRLGRGGMGVVYRARQASANRVVALKVVRADRLEGGSDEERRQWLDRFRREAHAAARLVHEHILPVYEVGEDRGRHFYSMRYVEGQSLDEALRERPLPDRDAAVCLERVARAVHYAHEQGILHRDLKPGNILLDADGRPFVTDFGLAKWSEGPQDMTQSGQWLGSPPYLSPEQARDAAGVTAAGDVYSLGATLYHALTGRPPFQAADVVETLRQVREEDPVPPRRLNPAVSADLETICLKCLHKEPARRYASALAFAEDLRRFLAGEPIHARPVGPVERLYRWCRRNPKVASLATALGTVLAAGITAVTCLWLLAESRRASALREKENAGRQRERAEQTLDQAMGVIDEFTAVSRKLKINNVDSNVQGRKRLLESAVKHYEEIRGQNGDDPRVLHELARAYIRLADVNKVMGSLEDALAAAQRSVDLFENLVNEHPIVTEYQNGLAAACEWLFILPSAPPARRQSVRRALCIRQELVRRDPDNAAYLSGLAMSYYNSAVLERDNERWPQARQFLDEARKVRKHLADKEPANTGNLIELARIHEAMHQMQGGSEEGLRSLGRARRVREQLAARNPNDADAQVALADCYFLLANAHADPDQAVSSHQQACQTLEKLLERSAREHPTISGARLRLAMNYYNMALTQAQRCEHFEGLSRVLTTPGKEILQAVAVVQQLEALRSFEKARDFSEKSLPSFPKDNNPRYMLGTSCYYIGVLKSRLTSSQETLPLLEKASAILEEVVGAEPGNDGRESELGEVLHELGKALVRQGECTKAVTVFQQAAKHQQAAFTKDKRNHSYRQLLNDHLESLAEVQRQLKRPAEAVEVTRQRGELWPGTPDRLFSVARDLARCVPLAGKGSRQALASQQTERDEFARQAIATLRRAIACGFKDVERLRQDPELATLRSYQEFEQLMGKK